MIFSDFVEQIYSELTIRNVESSEIFAQDIVDLFNQFNEQLRLDDIRSGKYISTYSVEKEYVFGTTSIMYPGLTEAELDPVPLKDLDIEDVLVTSLAYLTSNKIKNVPQTYTKGDIALKGTRLYKCISSFSSVNTYGRTFEFNNVDPYVKGRSVITGDVIQDPKTDRYFIATADFKPTGEPASEANFDELYWIFVGTGYSFGNMVPFEELRSVGQDKTAFAIFKDKIYSNDLGAVNLVYVPEYTQITDPTTTLDIPNETLLRVKEAVVSTLARRIGVPSKDNE